jgi:uncharacterized protein (DUF433 family)
MLGFGDAASPPFAGASAQSTPRATDPILVARKPMAYHDRIEIDPQVMLGKPVIRGTRIPVELLLRRLGEGASQADLLSAYPHLTREDILAAITYAADTIAHEEILTAGDARAGR